MVPPVRGGVSGPIGSNPATGRIPNGEVVRPGMGGGPGGRTVEVADPPVERWAVRVAAEHGFADVQHQVEVFGTCADCVAART